jgi:hypothetical protein
MEAAGAPRLDVERDSSWSAAQRGALVSVGCRGGTNRGVPDPKVLPSKVMPLRRPRNEAREYSYSWFRPTARSGRWRIELFIRPVLKHGPRSLTCMRAGGRQTH